MQKVGINELRKMILEEMGLEERNSEDVNKRVAKQKQQELQKAVRAKVFNEFSSQINIAPERRAQIALDLLNKNVSESQENSAEELDFIKSLEPYIKSALEAGNKKEVIEKIINDELKRIKSKKAAAEKQELPKEVIYFVKFADMYGFKGQNIDNIIVKSDDNTTIKPVNGAKGDTLETKKGLEDFTENKMGISLKEMVQISDNLLKADSVLQSLPDNQKEQVLPYLNFFRKVVKALQDDKDILKNIIKAYDEKVAEATKNMDDEEKAEYMKKANAVKQAMMKAYKLKEPPPEEVEEEVKQVIQSTDSSQDQADQGGEEAEEGGLSLDQEFESLGNLVSDLQSVFLAKNEETATEAINAIQAAGGKESDGNEQNSEAEPVQEAVDWMAKWAALQTFVTTNKAAAIMGGKITAALYVGKKVFDWYQNRLSKLQSVIPNKLLEGITPLVKYMREEYPTTLSNSQESLLIQNIKAKYAPILDENGERLNFKKIDEKQVPAVVSDALKKFVEEVRNQDRDGDSESIETNLTNMVKILKSKIKNKITNEFSGTYSELSPSGSNSQNIPTDQQRNEGNPLQESLNFDADKYAGQVRDNGPEYLTKLVAFLVIKELSMKIQDKEKREKFKEEAKKSANNYYDDEIKKALSDFIDNDDQWELKTKTPSGNIEFLKIAQKEFASIISKALKESFGKDAAEPHLEIDMDELLQRFARQIMSGQNIEEGFLRNLKDVGSGLASSAWKKLTGIFTTEFIDFLKLIKTKKGKIKFEEIIKSFKPKEQEKLAWYFEDRKRFMKFLQKHFEEDYTKRKRLLTTFHNILPGLLMQLISGASEKLDGNEYVNQPDDLEEALVPIVDKMIVEIYQELKEKT